MTTKKKITVTLVIVARNERKSSEVIFPKIPKKSVDTILVIDGNSTDKTQEYYKKRSIKVVEQKRKGLGAAMIEARQYVKTDAMIFFHPDGNENPKDIPKLAEALRAGHKFVIPSRMMKSGFNEEDKQFLRPRKWFNQTMAFLAFVLWKRKSPYTTEIVQGFRGIYCKTWDELKIDAYDCTVDFQMVIRAHKKNIKIYEFPTIEGKRLFGETNFRSIEIGLSELRMFLREIFAPSTYF